VYVGTGLGNAICIGGQLARGDHGVAGELGHIPVPGKTDVCSCGNIGCAENYVSGKALARIRNEQFPDTPIAELFLRHQASQSLESFISSLAMTIPFPQAVPGMRPRRAVLSSQASGVLGAGIIGFARLAGLPARKGIIWGHLSILKSLRIHTSMAKTLEGFNANLFKAMC
jgi:hypothetical protein